MASDMSDYVKYTMSMFKPGIMGPVGDFKQPALLTERRAKKALQLAECKLENIDIHTCQNEQFTDRLRKRVKLLNAIVFNSNTDDESSSDSKSAAEYNYHSEQKI